MEFYILTISSKPTGESGESCASKYALSTACPNCGTGALLEGNLITKRLKNIKSFKETLDGDKIISEAVFTAMNMNGIKLAAPLKNIVDTRGNALPSYHLTSTIYLPAAYESEGLIIEDQCPICKRNGYFNKILLGDLGKKTPTKVFPVGLKYQKRDACLLNECELINTYECMGLSSKGTAGGIIRYARPLQLVSSRIKELFESFDSKNLKFEKIEIL